MSFRDDPTKMLAIIREAGEQGKELSTDLLNEIKKNSGFFEINQENRRIIRDEITSILLSDNVVSSFEQIYKSGLLARIMPELEATVNCDQRSPSHKYNVFYHLLYSVQAIQKDPILRWVMLLHDISKPMIKKVKVDETTGKEKDAFDGHEATSAKIAVKILNRLGFDDISVTRMEKLIRYHCADLFTKEEVAMYIRKLGESDFELFIKIAEADYDAQSDLKLLEKEPQMQKIRDFADCIMNRSGEKSYDVHKI